MFYFAIINLSMAIMMIVVYVRYAKFRISYGHQIADLKKTIAQEVSQRESMEADFLKDSQSASEKVSNALREVDELRKSKESEMKLRLDAEKQIDLTLQRIDSVQKRMQDWRAIQDAVMKDTKDSIIQIGNDLFRKLSEKYKIESDSKKVLLENISQEITKNISQEITNSVGKISDSISKQNVLNQEPKPIKSKVNHIEKSVKELIEKISKSQLRSAKDYFYTKNIDENKAKFLLCDLAFIKNEKLYTVDFRINRYFEEYKINNNLKSLKQKIEKYFLYLKNPKYNSSITKACVGGADFKTVENVIMMIFDEERLLLEKIGYATKAKELDLSIKGFNELLQIILN